MHVQPWKSIQQAVGDKHQLVYSLAHIFVNQSCRLAYIFDKNEKNTNVNSDKDWKELSLCFCLFHKEKK